MEYIRRIIDAKLDLKCAAFGAINIIGPKGSGKTRTAKERSRTIIEFEDEDKRAGYLAIAETSPSLFLNNEKPILFDEWQDAPKVWGMIRKACDDNPEECGNFFLTGSTSKKIVTSHSGTMRISELLLYPMTLWETKDSNGLISLKGLFDNKEYDIDGLKSDLKLEDLFFIMARGGWPRVMIVKSDLAKLEIAKDYFWQICHKDTALIDSTSRNPEWIRTILLSYAHSAATLAKRKKIYADVRANYDVSEKTIATYIDALEQLFVITDIDAWSPQIRSKTAIRSSKKHIFVDPSIAMAALGIGPEYFYSDLDLFGHIFENLVFCDLLVYAEAHDAKVFHYSDDFGLEIDAVYQLSDGRYALIEIKSGENAIPQAEKNLLKFKELVKTHNEKVSKDKDHPGVKYREPDLLIVICAKAQMAFTTASGIKVIPIGCLKD